jgi:hypothetical protein
VEEKADIDDEPLLEISAEKLVELARRRRARLAAELERLRDALH